MTTLLQVRKQRAKARVLARREKFMPGGVPKHVRCYDNGGLDVPGGTTDRYTVVFTNARCLGTGGESPFLSMSESPSSSRGVCLRLSTNRVPIDTPTYGHLGKKIKFEDLPKDCQQEVIADYTDYWRLGLPPEGV